VLTTLPHQPRIAADAPLRLIRWSLRRFKARLARRAWLLGDRTHDRRGTARWRHHVRRAGGAGGPWTGATSIASDRSSARRWELP